MEDTRAVLRALTRLLRIEVDVARLNAEALANIQASVETAIVQAENLRGEIEDIFLTGIV